MLEIILLGFIQGITEFLPISSSGHLAIFHLLLGDHPVLTLDVLAHLGTLMAIIWFFRHDLFFLARGVLGKASKKIAKEQRWLLVRLILANLPIMVVGLFLGHRLPLFFANSKFLAIGFWCTALLLVLGRFWRFPVDRGRFFLIGVCQALAIVPGISRSATTIASGRILGESREGAFKFSFFLGLISIGGAVIYEAPQIVRFNNGQIREALVVVLVAFLSGLVALKTLHRLLLSNKMWYLSFYCLILGLAAFFLL
ncbi:MAG: undecaprenyl-diphosphate phosphatase [Candidatus Shapirobacteria bacterium]|nr:undecaprenyl-diphosphate phosphatase [Candidatus Shapirobacteria bacterium]MDD5073651.1 undecaprenyl-diphosphate phosphatase [Candidatus Shapirobacteria bacterium]MDD5481388.1 undecaprenyl-diphosphate phosphatase [Candidatus Shapirobacteria bacterium]